MQVDKESGFVVTPFVVLIDSQEQQPFQFTELYTDADKGHMPLLVKTQYEYLGHGRGDYTIEGYRHEIAIERKSPADLYGTILGWRERRDRFKRELAWLNSIRFGAVIVEATEGTCIKNPPPFGKKTARETSLILSRSIDSFRVRYPRVQWGFFDSRRLAEVKCFRWLTKAMEVIQEEEQAKKGA